MENSPNLHANLETQDLESELSIREADDTAFQNNDSKIAIAGRSEGAISSSSDSLPVPKFPNLISGVVLTLFFTLLINFFPLELNPVHKLWLVHLPMQLLWTSALFRLVQIGDRLWGTSTKDWKVAAISIVSYLFMPVFPSSALGRLADPFFLVWLASQIAATWLIGGAVDSSASKARTATRLKFTVIGNGYLLATIFLPFIVGSEVIFDFGWFLSQFAFLILANEALKNRLENLQAAATATDKEKNDLAFVFDKDIELRYRAYPAIERWMANRLSSKGSNHAIKQFFMWVLGPIFVVLGASAANLFFAVRNLDQAHPAAVQQAASAGAMAAAASVQHYMLGFAMVTGAIISTCVSKYNSNPTHILINKQGIRFSWRHRFSKVRESKIIGWKDLTHISLRRPEGKTSTLHDALVLESNDGKKTEIKLDSLDSFEDKEWLLKAIKNWAPNVSRDAEVLQALQAPADYSYTELWLQALSAPPKRERLKPLVPGVKLKSGKYEVIKSIGVGGQGQAYLASDAISKQALVLKEFILPVFVDMSVRKGALEQFENEARILRQLDHPQVVKLLDYFVEDHRAYLVLEHIDGGSLRQLVEKQGALSEAQVRSLAEQMCKILAYLHGLEPPVVHRDFTPDNLILNHDGTLKLIDFNVAQQQESTTSGTVVGKHAYLPPEQFRGMPGTQSDIYAMGATLFYLLTGKDPEPISRSHPKKELSSLSASIDDLVAKATTISLKDRYARVEDLADDLHTAT